MKAQKLFATLTLGLIVAAGVIAKFLPVTMAISRTAIVFGAALGVAFNLLGDIVRCLHRLAGDFHNHTTCADGSARAPAACRATARL